LIADERHAAAVILNGKTFVTSRTAATTTALIDDTRIATSAIEKSSSHVMHAKA